jgi:hypothetical protein
MVSAFVYRNAPRAPHVDSTPISVTTVCIQDWGRCGTFIGANVGIILGAIFVAIPFTSEIPGIGLFRTLLVGVIACAVMAGGFAALAAVLYSKTHTPVLAFAPRRTNYRDAA